MKQLYIQNKRVFIDENTYFPFTHKISDLEDVNIVYFPTTKTVSIPRCKQNDEIFGYIGDINRINVDSNDNKIGVSFNQIKQCEYILYNDNIEISRGLVLIDSITDNNYEITLYDQLIKKLEELDGDQDTGEYYLTDLDLFDDFKSNSINTKNIITGLTMPIVPVVGIKENENDLDDGAIRCQTISGSSITQDNVDLPTDCTSLQLRTVKSYEMNYACPLSTTINAINTKYGNTLLYDDEIKYLMDETYMLLGSPKNEENAVQNEYNLQEYSNNFSSMSYRILTTGGTDVCVVNGNKVFNMNVEMVWNGDTTSLIGGRVKQGFGTWDPEYHYETTPDGTIFSKVWIKVSLSNNTKTSAEAYYEINLVKGVNTTFYDVELYDGIYIKGIILNTNLTINLDYYPEFDSSINPTFMSLGIYDHDPGDPSYKWKIMDGLEDVQISNFSIKPGSTLTESSLKFRSNDVVTTKKIMPKISIKSFIMQLAKFYNLDIIIEDEVLKLVPKNYYLSNDRLLVDSINNITTNNITFNRLKLNTTLPKDDALTAYKEKYKSAFGTQTIDTGYSIKKSIKEITLDTVVPPFMRDFNSFAYQNFGKYMNGGYSKQNYGIINDVKDKLVLCYVNEVNDRLHITDDTPFEGGMTSFLFSGATESKFLHFNPFLYVDLTLKDNDSNKWLLTGATDLQYGCAIVDKYYTVSPYMFEQNEVISSLEMSRPEISYCGLRNNNYPVETTLYYKHHRNMLIDKYNSNTHIIDCNVFINGPIDINKIYNYHNSFYVISEIIEYDPTIPGIYNVKLMRVNDINNYIFNRLGDNNYLKNDDGTYLRYDDNWKIIINEKTIE